jgi:uncharacterized membrane protein YdbT with pleckstrin-like domain
MKYNNNKLMIDETIVFQTKLNWILYARGLIILALGLIVDSYGMLLILVGLLILLLAYINVRFSEFIVTDKRILIKDGFFRTQSLDIHLDKIENIHVEQGIIGKIVNRGSIVVREVEGMQYFYFNIDKPFKFREAVNKQIPRM